MRAARGFTLIEVMIALTLLTLIMVAVVAAMRTLGNTRATIDKVTDRVDEIRVVSDFLRKTIGAAIPVPLSVTDQEAFGEFPVNGTWFLGDSEQMVWVAPMVAGANSGGSFVLLLTRVEEALELRWQLYQPQVAEVSWSDTEGRSLVHAIEEFEIGYLPAYGSEWVEEWPVSLSSPAAVRLSIKSRDRYWPELVIRLSGSGLPPSDNSEL